jgi:hypothetical protein
VCVQVNKVRLDVVKQIGIKHSDGLFLPTRGKRQLIYRYLLFVTSVYRPLPLLSLFTFYFLLFNSSFSISINGYVSYHYKLAISCQLLCPLCQYFRSKGVMALLFSNIVV